jgi:general secretion pathway protein G
MLANRKYRSLQRGFTLIEMMVTVVIVAILATMAVPLTQLAVKRSKEIELKSNLWEIRAAIDAYKAAWDDGHITHEADSSGYPPSLKVLVDGVTDARDPLGHKLRFLRRIPRDPFADDSLTAEQTWGKRSYASEADHPQEGADVYDIYSLNPDIGINQRPYSKW